MMRFSEETELRQALGDLFKENPIYGDKGRKLVEFLTTRSCQKPYLFPKMTKKEVFILAEYLGYLDLGELITLYGSGIGLMLKRRLTKEERIKLELFEVMTNFNNTIREENKFKSKILKEMIKSKRLKTLHVKTKQAILELVIRFSQIAVEHNRKAISR